MAFHTLKPGDTGTTTILLHNDGSEGGSVAIWVSNITETDARADGAMLDTYLLFSLSNERLASTLDLPAPISTFPQEPGGSPALTVTQLDAGATATLTWHWEFTETGTPQDDAQGDTLSFTVHYTLTSFPGEDTGGGGHTHSLPGDEDTHHSPTTTPGENRTTPATTTATGEQGDPEEQVPLAWAFLIMLLIPATIRLRHEPDPRLQVAGTAGTFILLAAALPLDYRVLCRIQPPDALLAVAVPVAILLIPLTARFLRHRHPTPRTLWAGECTLLFLSVAAGFGLLAIGASPFGSLLALAAVYLVALGAVLIMER
ncbi:MAG: hypothetical protein PHP59_11660 [Methanofollis sp.]|uniref:hypothetical protein n=1 Tax=Methanofollis sp. TaxID=2052835 RepID=UPI00261F626D|nr:hypothetical protein [Methanofollis sp.]MDD4256015.1 hypothetical protein [Methanofollis sp.]